MTRDLAVTLRMLEAEGLQVRLVRSHGRLELMLDAPRPGQATVQASFGSRDADSAAEWLVARVFDLYPQSQISKVWRTIQAAAMAAQEESAMWQRSGGKQERKTD